MSFILKSGKILSLATDENVYRRGEKYYNEGNVAEMGVMEQENPAGSIVWARVTGSGNRVYSVRIVFRQNGTMEGYRCNCDAASIWKGACKHVVAAMLSLSHQSAANLEQVFSDRVKAGVINHFKTKLISKIDSDFVTLQNTEHKKASLTPTLHIEKQERHSLSFGVGFSRQYVVRNVKSFILQVQGGAMVKYGKGLEFRHDISVFDEVSQRLIEALIRFYDSVSELEKLGSHVFRSFGSGMEGRFVMPAWFCDIFFDIYGEIGFAVNAPQLRHTQFEAVRQDSRGRFGFVVSERQGGVALKPVTHRYVVIEGECADYFLTADGFCEMDKGAAADFIALNTGISKLRAEAIVADGPHADNFRAYVIPQLRRSGLIVNDLPDSRTPEQIQADPSLQEDAFDAAKTCRVKFYLDVQGRGDSLTCRVEFENPDGSKTGMFDNVATPEGYEQLWIRAFLRHYGFVEDRAAAHFSLATDEQVFNFYLSGVQTAAKIGEVFATDAFEKRKIRYPAKPNPHVRIRGGLLEVGLELEGYSLKELADAVGSYRLAKKYHRLRDGRFINLEDENIELVVRLLSSADVSKKDAGTDTIVTPLYRVLELDEDIRELSGGAAMRDEAVDKLISDIKGFGSDSAGSLTEVPQSLAAIMRSYQKTGFRWLNTLASYGFGGILADEMGLGKTLQLISLLLAHKEEHGRARAIVVAPTSLIYNWEHEIAKFAPSLTAAVIAGTPQRRKELLDECEGHDVIITTYDTLKRDLDNYSRLSFDYVIADEAQYMKNPVTQNSAAVKAVNGRARFALTGTPVENSVSELWSIFDFVMPGFLYGQSKFNKIYADPITKDGDTEAGLRLRKQVEPFILRRRKADVLSELPEKVETTQYSIMTDKQRLLYNAKLLEAQGAFESVLQDGSFETSKLDILSHITRLRQICAHPSLFLEDYNGGSSKLSDLLETIHQAIDGGHRILLFSQFATMLRIIREELRREGIGFFYLDGASEAGLRKTMADQFNNGEKKIFLISLRAGGLGLNLTGADVVIHYDQWWNPAVMAQASDRAHRLGQTRTVQVINLIMKDSIEEKILLLQERKRALTDMVVSEGASFINKLSVEDVRELFRA